MYFYYGYDCSFVIKAVMIVSAYRISQVDTAAKLRLYLCSRDNAPKLIVVTRSSKITILDKLFPNCTNNYIYDGVILSTSQSFKFYGIKNEECIYVSKPNENISKNELKSIVNNVKETHKDSELSFRTRAASDNEFRRECFRLNDIRLARNELKQRPQRLLIVNEKASAKPIYQFLPVAHSLSISSTPLPRFW